MNKAKILVGITHYPHVNFFKHAVRILQGLGYFDLELVVQPRGRLVSIVERELPDVPRSLWGQHRSSLIAKLVDTAQTEARLLSHYRRRRFDVVTGVRNVTLTHVAWIYRRPSVVFEDDIEYKLGFLAYKPLATRVVMPASIPYEGRNVVKYRGFKELAYLHPKYFKPDEQALAEYGLRPGRFVFVREVSGTSLNYRHIEQGALARVCPSLRDMGFGIVLSLENKTLRALFKDQCIILEEPVRDIHSLLHFAALTISSGDSMARESCLVGTPAIYTGRREMAIHAELEKRGCFFNAADAADILDAVETILRNNIKGHTMRVISEAIGSEWEDTTEVIVNNLLSVIHKDDSLVARYRAT